MRQPRAGRVWRACSAVRLANRRRHAKGRGAYVAHKHSRAKLDGHLLVRIRLVDACGEGVDAPADARAALKDVNLRGEGKSATRSE